MSLGPDARSLIAMADGADDPSSADEARIRAKLAARLAIAAGTGIAATTAAKTATAGAGKAATMTLATKLAIGVAVVSATTGGAVLYERASDPVPVDVHVHMNVHDTRPTAVTAKPIAATTPAPSADPIPEPPIPAPAEPAVTATAHAHAQSAVTATASPAQSAKIVAKPTTSASKTATDTIAEEAALLRAAHRALASGDGATAMRSLDEHARRFPRGSLAEEREAAKVLAFCAQGRASDARASASAFVSANPRSPFAAQVRRSCATKDQ